MPYVSFSLLLRRFAAFFVVPGCFRPQVAAVRAQPGKALHTKPHRTSPHPTSPRRAQPRHARPSHAPPCLTTSSPLACRERMWCQVVFDRRRGGQRTAWQNAPCHTLPSHAEPHPATPNQTRPYRTMISPSESRRTDLVPGRFRPLLRRPAHSPAKRPCLALPCRTSPNLTTPDLTLPCCALISPPARHERMWCRTVLAAIKAAHAQPGEAPTPYHATPYQA